MKSITIDIEDPKYVFSENKECLNYPKRIEITEQIKGIIETCRRPFISPSACEDCILSGPCVEYFTGDDNFNR